MLRKKLSSRRFLFKKEQYHQAPSPLSQQSREQRRQVRGHRLGFKRQLLILATLAGMMSYFYFFGFIRQVAVVGLDSETSAEVKRLADQYIHRSWYGTIKPFSNIGRLSDSIELADSRFNGTRVEYNWFSDEVVIYSTLREPVARWQSSISAQTYFIDSDGVAFTDSDRRSDNLPVVHDTTELKIFPGQQSLSTNVLNFILLIDSELSHQKVFEINTKTYLLVESPKEIQLQLSDVGYKIRFNTSRGARDQATELKTVIEHLNSTKVLPNSYIDLRIDDTAYYR